jgi:hypothetical protein
MTTDVRLTSGLTRTVFFFMARFFVRKKIRTTRRQWRQSSCLPYTTGGIHSQNKHDRHTYSRFRLLEVNSPRDSRKHSTKSSKPSGSLSGNLSRLESRKFWLRRCVQCRCRPNYGFPLRRCHDHRSYRDPGSVSVA